MNLQLQKYEEVMGEMMTEVDSPKSKNKSLSPFLKRGVGRSESRRFSMGKNATASDMSKLEMDTSRSPANSSGHWALSPSTTMTPTKPEKGGAGEEGGGATPRRARLRSVEFADDFKVEEAKKEETQIEQIKRMKDDMSAKRAKENKKKKDMMSKFVGQLEKSADERRASIFTAETAKKMMSHGAKKVSRKKKMQYVQVKKDHQKKVMKNEILKKRAEESRKSRERMRKMRAVVQAERTRRNHAARVISRNWR